jgi:large subunit ribosomal protein L22
MESKTYIKNVKITPKKLRFLLPAIKGLRPVQALERLAYTPKAAARVFYKAIHSAVSNAKTKFKTTDEALKFKTLLIEEGQKLKRFRAGGRGMARPYVRKFAHIKIVLEADNVKSLPKEKVEKNGTKSSS